ncbi:MAG TPA: hypothetical protein VFH99_03380 [Candidatus Saccharimonadales bacterium]|nr:hypothetical protein [Candidatus Saccharimonadales bacterium]
MSTVRKLKASITGNAFFYVPLAVIALFTLVLIVHYGVNTPFYDQWEMVPLFQKIDHHTLGFADLWRQHNEHRIFFPLLAALISAYITHWQTSAEVLIGFICAVATATLLFRLVKKTILRWTTLAGALIAAWFFSPVQWGNWLWGWQLEWFMCVLFVVATIFLLFKFVDPVQKRYRKELFAGALATAFLATFSLASGVFAWLIGIFLLAFGKQPKKPVIIWTAAGILTTALYYYHYAQTETPNGPATTVLVHHVFLFVEFFVAFIGSIAGANNGNIQTADLVGAMLLLAVVPLLWVVWTRRDKNLRLCLPWLAIILYGLLCALSTAFGRLGYGIGFALSSRYTTLSLLYIIGLIGLTFTLLINTERISRSTKHMIIGLVVLFNVPILISSYVIGVQGFQSQSALFKEIKSCTHAQDPTDSCLQLTYPNPQVVRPRLEYVKAKGLAGY